ncbi:MAG: hypothetical protein KDB61_11065 [Planctomycetes bacterium]|nr:hypothetical protein [Planctomycetota bacterium]
MKHISKTLTLGIPAALLLAASCGSEDPAQAGYAALQSGDFQRAESLLKSAQDAASTDGAKAHELGVARCQALAHLDPVDCQRTFLDLAQATPTMDSRDFELVAGELIGLKAYDPAAFIVGAGITRFPEDERLPKLMEKLQGLAQSGDAPGLQATLTGLGYGGQ